MAFKIFYDDRCEYDSESEDDMPGRGVQVIVQDHPDIGAEMVCGADYYVLDKNGRWRGVDIFGLFDYLLDSGVVVFGRMITEDQYSKICKEAMDMKNGWRPKERKPKR
jgi:hypothetical protein